MKSIFVLLAAAISLVGSGSVPNDLGDGAATGYIAVERPTPEKPLNKTQVTALIDKLTDSILNTTEDDDSAQFLNDRWNERKDLVGKTRKQIVRLLFDDLRTQIEDKETLGLLWSDWTGETKLPPENFPTPTPTPKPTN